MNRERNIQQITENALCTACGACSGICKFDAISMITNTAGYIVAKINYEKCINCELCYHICPSVIENTPQITNEDIFHGSYIEGYVGYATNIEIRQNSQSGGIVTALLCYLLNSGRIDGAIINKFNKITKRPEAVFENTLNGIKKSSGSYYAQSSVVSEILKHQGKKTAAVVLGCQAESINLINRKYPKTILPEYLIGLICAGQYSGNYIDKIIEEAECNKQQVTKFRFRDKSAGGWPGNTKITTIEKDYILDKNIRQVLKPIYEVHRCLFCFDQMNIYSDITVGDPWGITDKCEKKGNTVIIVRTEKGKALIESAVLDGVINVEKLAVKKIINGQTIDNRLKTQFFTSMRIAKEKNYRVPFEIEAFKNDSYKESTKNKHKLIKSRLEFSKKIYLEEDKDKYEKIISSAIKKVKSKAYIKLIFNFFNKSFRYMLKKIGIKK